MNSKMLDAYLPEDVVQVKFNYPAYISHEENPFETRKLYEKANKNAETMSFVVQNMLSSPNMIEAGQVVEMKFSMAEKYLRTTYPRNYHLAGEIGSYSKDPNWKHEIALAEIVQE